MYYQQNENRLQSLRMVIKFREVRIKELERKREQPPDSGKEQLQNEIDLLTKQMFEHPDSAKHLQEIGQLKRTLQCINSLPNVQKFKEVSVRVQHFSLVCSMSP